VTLPIIIYEGPENSGKTTVKRTVNELINHRSLSFERWTGTQYAYGKLFGRQIDLEELLEIDRKMTQEFDVLLVYLTCPPKIILSRVNTDPIADLKYHLTEVQLDALTHFFEEWYEKCPFWFKMRFDTSVTKPDVAAFSIKDYLKRIGYAI